MCVRTLERNHVVRIIYVQLYKEGTSEAAEQTG